MLRLIERLFGEGHLRDSQSAGVSLAVAYELDVYRDWTVEGETMTPGEWVVEGHVLGAPEALAALSGRSTPFHLAMDDGRTLEVFVLDEQGRIVNVEGTTFTVAPGR